jgi:exoribonuclease II
MTIGQLPSWFDRWTQRWMPSPQQVALAELKHAQLHVLESQTRAEYADLRMQISIRTTEYHRLRIERLQAFLAEHEASMMEDCGVDLKDIIEFKTGMRVAAPG